ncbi:MAG: hypothetical protein QOH17_473, partial [Pseudonocardiales bacterium]|nr:hypothetical protein [Pseudonocardiales bacterium]
MSDDELLAHLETYYDAVPRGRADTEQIGPLTLFVARSGWPYYARPSLGGASPISVDDVRRVLDRQRKLGVPLSLEWVAETTPGLEQAAMAAGMRVEHCPLLVLEGEPAGGAGTARMLGPGDAADLALSRAAISVSFEAGGIGRGGEGLAARDAARDAPFAQVNDTLRDRLAEGAIRAAAAYVSEQPELGPVGGGSHTPVGAISEIAGVGVLPAFRQRGLAGALTYVLARDALDHGVTTVFCSAQ